MKGTAEMKEVAPMASDETSEPPAVTEDRLRREIARVLADAAPEDWTAIRYTAATVGGIADVDVGRPGPRVRRSAPAHLGPCQS
ncbi:MULTISPECIES: hypothetical protein [Microbacterium]|uniref:hypothetical protein n=1 Tax=Microbacterium TaxID=33882 RepID=UPI00217E047C|nr:MULTISPECIES: hypothetical protein [Microbacterium]UWF77601.1 hypothetical protein JSY13_00455 [Microbacterium neungamense]WCM55772.1 hypothetical protein JRG78_00470 [Microbacterium sp. EF45047]